MRKRRGSRLLLTLSQGVGGADLTALRAAVVSAQGAPTDMAVMPTISVSASADAAFTVSYPLVSGGAIANADKYGYGGGAPKLYNSNNNLGFKSVTALTAGNIGGSDVQNAYYLAVKTASRNVGFRVFLQNQTRFRVLSRDSSSQPWKYATVGGAPVSFGGNQEIKIDYGADLAGRETMVIMARTAGDTGTGVFTQIRVGTGHTATAPIDNRFKLCVISDSYGDGSSASFLADGWVSRMQWELGMCVTLAASGGTGIITAGAQYNYQNPIRLDDATLQNFDGVMITPSINDGGQSGANIQTGIGVVLAGLRQRVGFKKPLLVAGLPDLNAPSPPSANHLDQVAGIAAGAGLADKVFNFTGISLAAVSNHPEDAGHAALSASFVSQMKSWLGV